MTPVSTRSEADRSTKLIGMDADTVTEDRLPLKTRFFAVIGLALAAWLIVGGIGFGLYRLLSG